MTDPTPPAAGEPEDVQPVETSEYWIGYYNGKAAAMRNLGTIRRIELERSRRRLRRSIGVLLVIDLAVFAAGFYALWPGALGDAPIWAHFAVGIVFGSWLGQRSYQWWHSA